SDFSTDVDKNLFRLTNFPLRLCTSFSVLGDCSFITTSALSGHALIPFMLITLPRNIPSSALKASAHRDSLFWILGMDSSLCGYSVTISHSIGNLSIPWAVDGTA
nr:hypothetical protein [Tanacetum cinerariifolium]